MMPPAPSITPAKAVVLIALLGVAAVNTLPAGTTMASHAGLLIKPAAHATNLTFDLKFALPAASATLP